MNKVDVENLITKAIKSQSSEELCVFRNMKEKITEFEKNNKNSTPNESECLTILIKMVKDRQKSIEMCKQNTSNDPKVIVLKNQIIEKEQKQIDIIKRFIPEEMTEEQIKQQLIVIISEVGNNFGLIMKTFNQKFSGQNSKTVSSIIKTMV